MSDIRNKLSARDSHIWSLRVALVGLLALLGYQQWISSKHMNEITVHVPPDLSQGARLKPGELQPASAYAFAHYVWRGINEWPESGRKDYGNNIETFKCMITPTFAKYLVENIKEKQRQGELDRTRALFTALAYQPGFVTPLGNNTYSVAMVMKLREYVNGLPIKDAAMKYSLRVVPDSRACNPSGMALDGFVVDPTRKTQEVD